MERFQEAEGTFTISNGLTILQQIVLTRCTQFTPKIFEAHDVDIVNECCGVCGSDVHTITGGWGDLSVTPLCVGHEIIGKVIAVGKEVTTCKVGDRVGVGAQVQSCMQCKNCKSDNENYCPHMVGECSIKFVIFSAILTSFKTHTTHHTIWTKATLTRQ
jgi:threonine dehydrogenase-like Zn-dependent dehydrogenase